MPKSSYGRMITKDIAHNKALWEEVSDMARWIFPFVIPHTDLDAHVCRDARSLRIISVPLANITDQQMESIIQEWLESGICKEDGESLVMVDFMRCNSGLRSIVERRSRQNSKRR